MKRKYFVLSDNNQLHSRFVSLLEEKELLGFFDFYCSPGNQDLIDKGLNPLNISLSSGEILEKYSIGFSIHSKQMFPKELVYKIPCINIHPGFNPYNRGWFPQVFSIVNDEVIGATIHYMDEKLDNGKIIDRLLVVKEIWDTSETLYLKILDAEMALLERNISAIICNTTTPFEPEFLGKLYLKKDFDELCRISLEKTGSFLEFYNLLRATTFSNYKNAFFIDSKTGKKVFISVNISHE
jgi:dTDP-4-amino-4,6-dideoxyglucose formyltransferase